MLQSIISLHYLRTFVKEKCHKPSRWDSCLDILACSYRALILFLGGKSEKKKTFSQCGSIMSYVTIRQNGLKLRPVMKGTLPMEKKITLLIVVFVVIGLFGSIVMALPPIGPPRAMVGQDRWAVDVGFSHSKMDLEANGTTREDPSGAGWLVLASSEHKIEDLTSNIVLGRISFGAYDTIDVFACLGLSNAQDDMTETQNSNYLVAGNRYSGMEAGYGFAYGFGARATFWQEGDITWGGFVQILWENPRDGDIDLAPEDGDPSKLSGDVEIDLQEIQVAVGPTIDMGIVSLYGGPFLHIVSGDLDADISGIDSFSAVNRVSLSQDVEEESEFGGFVGALGEMDKDTSWFAEFQVTSDAWGIGIGGIRKF